MGRTLPHLNSALSLHRFFWDPFRDVDDYKPDYYIPFWSAQMYPNLSAPVQSCSREARSTDSARQQTTLLRDPPLINRKCSRQKRKDGRVSGAGVQWASNRRHRQKTIAQSAELAPAMHSGPKRCLDRRDGTPEASSANQADPLELIVSL